jgi:ribonuclease BN (tRNA processing enzyme)
MRLTVIGSGDAFNSSGRGHACYLVQSSGAGNLMIDFGATALMSVRRAGIEPALIDGVAFTHLHGDHFGGFPFLVIDALYNRAQRRAFEVLGPQLTAATLHELMRITYGDVVHELPKVAGSMRELAPGEHTEFLGYRIEGFAADHMPPPHRPLCLRVTSPDGKSIAFSGDTKPCAGLTAAADGVELLVAECTRMAAPAGSHCTWNDWAMMSPSLRAGRVLLTHLGADVRAQLASSQTPRPIELADDGMIIDLG